MKVRTLVAAAGVGLVAATAFAANPAAAEPAVIEFGSFMPPKARSLNEILIPWLRKVEVDSADTLKFQEFWGRRPDPQPARKQWEGLKNGIQGAIQVLPAHTAKLFPDFTFYSLPFLFRVTPLLKSHVDLPLGTRSFFIAIHNRAYNKLPRQAKDAIEKNKGLGISLALGRYYERDGQKLRTETGGRNVLRLSDDEWTKMARRFKPFHDQWIAKTKDGAVKYRAIQEILAKHRGGG